MIMHLDINEFKPINKSKVSCRMATYMIEWADQVSKAYLLRGLLHGACILDFNNLRK